MNKFSKFSSSTPEETGQLGRMFAAELRNGAIVALQGDLGAGKTTFIKGLVSGLIGIDENQVSSPTFTYLHIYPGKNLTVFHFDLYRLQKEADFLNAGFDEYLQGDGIVCIEWSERIPSLLPSNTRFVHLAYEGTEKRTIKLS